MSARRRPGVAAIAALLLLLGATSVANARHGTAKHRPHSTRPVARLEGTDVWPAGTRPAPEFAGHDQNGHLITRNSLRGTVWAITFLDSHCTTQCPVEAHALGVVQRQLGRRYPVKVIVVSVSPRSDTPATVRAFLHKEGIRGDWHWLLGTRKQLAPIWTSYGIWVVSNSVHTSAVYLVDTRGNVRVADGVPFIPNQLASSVRALTPG